MLFIWAKYTFKYRLNIGYGFINSIRRWKESASIKQAAQEIFSRNMWEMKDLETKAAPEINNIKAENFQVQ